MAKTDRVSKLKSKANQVVVLYPVVAFLSGCLFWGIYSEGHIEVSEPLALALIGLLLGIERRFDLLQKAEDLE